jgi:YVTN family beta-propeller protein
MLSRIIVPLMALALFIGFESFSLAGTSNSLMDVSPDGKLLLVANSDNSTVTVVDTASRKALREIKVGDKPEGVTWIGAGPLAAVTVYREDRVVFLDAEKGQVIERLKVANEPYGIVSNKSGTKAWITHEYPGTISEIDLASRKVTREMKAGVNVRGLALSSDETRLYVTEFYTAKLHAVDLQKGEVVDTWKGHSTDNLCRNVVINPRRPKAYLSHIRSKIDTVDGNGSIFPHLSVCSLVPPDGTKRRTSIAMDTYNNVYVVTNPW